MKKDGILNTNLISEVAAIGHTQYPKGVNVLDISLTKGVPGFMQVLEAVNEELVSEAYILAEEIKEGNRELETQVHELLKEQPVTYVPHEEFKKLTEEAQVIVRTGETSSFANIILVAGVNF